MNKRLQIFSAGFLLATAFVFGFSAMVAEAAPAVTITVNTLDNTSTSGDGACSLSEAINNFNAQADTTGNDCSSGAGETLINFGVSGQINISFPLTVISTVGLTIDGSGQNVVLDGEGFSSVLREGPGRTLAVRNLAFQNAAGSDGALNNSGGIVSVANCTFRGNFTNAIANGGGTLNITGSYFANNTAAIGAAIFNDSGPVNLTNSTFYNNTSSQADGGAIFNNNGGTITIANCTFSKNTATTNGSAFSNGSGGTATIINTIFANSVSGTNCLSFGTFNADASNLSDDNSCDNATQATSAQINLDSAPANNGGPTLTIKLLPGSVAIDAGRIEFDQRGANFLRTVNNRVDVGAFEVQATPTPIPCDNDSPNITVPSDITAHTGKKKLKGAVVTFSVSAFDNEDGPVTATANPPSGTFFPDGITTVVVNASDHCGNCAVRTFTVTVQK